MFFIIIQKCNRCLANKKKSSCIVATFAIAFVVEPDLTNIYYGNYKDLNANFY